MYNSRKMAWILVSVIASIGLLCAAVMAAEAEPKIGIVDLERVHKDAPRMKQYWEDISALKASLESKLEIRIQNMMLQQTEVEELVTLKTKPNRTDQETARVTELEKIERDRDSEFKTLQGTKELTEDQKKRMTELQDIKKKSEETGTALTKDYDEQLKSKLGALDKQAEGELREAIGKVAAAKGMSIVLAKEVVLFGGTDVTDDVIGKLDRKAQ